MTLAAGLRLEGRRDKRQERKRGRRSLEYFETHLKENRGLSLFRLNLLRRCRRVRDLDRVKPATPRPLRRERLLRPQAAFFIPRPERRALELQSNMHLDLLNT